MNPTIKHSVLLLFAVASVAELRANETPLQRVIERLESGRETRVVCFGDSITGAYYHSGGTRAWCDMLGFALQKTYPHANLTSINAGISGNTTVNALTRIDNDVIAKKPHLVVVMFGMNDVVRVSLDDFRANMQTIVRKCREIDAAVVLCTPNSVYENGARPNARLAEFAAAVHQVANENELPVVDFFKHWTEQRQDDETAWMLWMSDGIHPNMNGHRRFAELIANNISGRNVSLDGIEPPPEALHHTFDLLQAGKPVKLVAMPPFDEVFPAALKKHFPEAEIETTRWPVEGKDITELNVWAKQIRGMKPDLVVPAVPADVEAANDGDFIRNYEWVLNWSFPFAGRDWDIVPVHLEAVVESTEKAKRTRAQLARQIVIGKDGLFVDGVSHLDAWVTKQFQTWQGTQGKLPARNGRVYLPAQSWPQSPGPRRVRASVYYPGGMLENVNAETGIMLTLHNWGGEDCAGTANPNALADRLNVVAICVNYLQSGLKASIKDPEPYDFGYLQGLDAIRALAFVFHGLKQEDRPFHSGRLFCTGGSGGGNVTQMAAKLAPRTFACVIDMCGMKKLSHDIAYNLPGGSGLNARWSRDPASPNYLSADEQELRFAGFPKHLAKRVSLGTPTKIVVVHGRDDATCPFADAEEMVANMQAAGIDVEPHFLSKDDLDGKVFTSSGHALGNRTEIVFRVAGQYLLPGSDEAILLKGPTDFERRDEEVTYSTSGGRFVISYRDGLPVGRFEPNPLEQAHDDHQDMSYYQDNDGKRQPIKTREDWEIRRNHILAGLQKAMGQLPGPMMRVPLAVKVLEESQEGEITRRKISYQSDPFDRVTAWLLTQTEDELNRKKRRSGKVASAVTQRPAVLCLHQTTSLGKDEPVGFGGNSNMHYAAELAKRGYIVLAPDYPSLGEHTYEFADHPEFVSGSMKAIWDNIRAVDYLATFPEVDTERIGVIGHSLGGHNAMFTAAFDTRLKVIVSSCGFTRFAKDDVPSWTGPRYMLRIATQFENDAARLPFDFPEIIASFAPRPFLAVAATKDRDFDIAGVRESLEIAQPVYELFGAGNYLQGDYPESPHDFPPDARERAYRFLDDVLKPKK